MLRRDIVPGDVVKVTAGDLVPADCRLLAARDLHVQQAALTGESMPVEKDATEQVTSSGTGPQARNLVFLGTSVVSGIARAVGRHRRYLRKRMWHSTCRNSRGVVTAAAFWLFGLACQPQGGSAASPQRPATQETPKTSSFRKPSDEELRKRLTREQYEVTQHEGTEAPFHNEYWNNHQPGIYVDVVSGEPLFSSLDKYDSRTGWPSFTAPLEPGNITTRTDRGVLVATAGLIVATEVRSALADSHLGHVFDDGPAPAGLRYCMNSAALRFIPVARLAQEGYGKYLRLFQPGGGKSARDGGESP